jgi:hypothetical protein
VCPDHAARRGGPFARLPSVNGVPEVLDTATGLVWRRCAEGQAWTGSTCGGTPVTLTWQAALDHAKQQARPRMAWRLPNIKELSSLVDRQHTWPALDPVVFPGATSDNYQSSTTMRWDNDPFGVNFVNFALGEIQPWDFLDLAAVRLVRNAR